MPRSRSSQKSHRKSEKRRAWNKVKLSRTRTEVKKARALVQEGKTEEAKKQVATAFKHMDKAAKRNVIHPNKAARDKSRLAKKLAAAAKK
ncbi:MAG: 30S ribosomal protein S20 [Planctomycetes bacterium]|jgi:small subunit ribosomal protein S20|nr:30S ribosomal protein S20 [Planctomycetota bacterium]